MADLLRDFWIRETGTGQQVAQLHDRYMMMTMIEWRRIYLILCSGGSYSGTDGYKSRPGDEIF